MATQPQVRVVSLGQTITVVFTMALWIVASAIVWSLGATTTFAAIDWVYFLARGEHLTGMVVRYAPAVAFSIFEVVRWALGDRIRASIISGIKVVERLDWATTWLGLLLTGITMAGRGLGILELSLPLWANIVGVMAIAVVAVPVGWIVTFWPERQVVEAFGSIAENIKIYWKAK